MEKTVQKIFFLYLFRNGNNFCSEKSMNRLVILLVVYYGIIQCISIEGLSIALIQNRRVFFQVL